MRKLVTAMLGIAAVCVFSATTAQAAPINVRQVTLGDNFIENNLQEVFNGIGATSISAATEQLVYGYFTTQGLGSTSTQLIVELAGNASSNEYGIYKLGSPATQLTVFTGAAGPGTKVGINFGLASTTTYDINTLTLIDSEVGFGSQFGFYLKTGGGSTFYSEDALNPGGAAQALVYKGEGNWVTLPGGPIGGGSDANHYYLAWEDVLRPGGDFDYNDGVFMVESVDPIPEPGLIGLLGMGFFGVASSLRRRRRA